MNAQEAKSIVEQTIHITNQNELTVIYAKIEEAAKRGVSVLVVEKLNKSIITQLESDGYQIQFRSTDPRDQKKSDYYVILW